ncbi:hypothetical protein TSOC_009547, partial [Tetrabaena socialis]
GFSSIVLLAKPL